MVKNKSRPAIERDQMELVSFKLSEELFVELSTYAKTQFDESGKQLSASLAARRLMLESLERRRKKKG